MPRHTKRRWTSRHFNMALSVNHPYIPSTGPERAEMLDAIGVSGTPTEVGRKLRTRNDFADRCSLILYNQAGDEAVRELLAAARQ